MLTNGQHCQTDILRDVRLPINETFALCKLHELARTESQNGSDHHTKNNLVGPIRVRVSDEDSDN